MEKIVSNNGKSKKVPNIIFEKCNYFLPRLMFLNSTHAAQIHWGDLAITLHDFPEDYSDISSKEFWDIWMEKWRNTGDNYSFNANKTSLAFCKRRLFRSAAACYHWAEFMYFADPIIKTNLRMKVKMCFQKSLDYEKLNIKTGKIEFQNTEIPYYLLLPDNLLLNHKVPCVILSNGLDSMTEIEIFSFAEQFISVGIAAFLFDGPGQGINLGRNPIELKFEIVVEKIIDFVHDQDMIDSSKLIFFGVSFGGYLALRVAKFLGNKFKCVVNLSGGPLLSKFSTMPRRLKEDFKYAFMETENNKMESIFKEIYLEMGNDCATEILSIHGGLDDIFPLDSIKKMDSNLKKKHKLIIYNSESHVCLNYVNLYCVEILSWVISKISKNAPIKQGVFRERKLP